VLFRSSGVQPPAAPAGKLIEDWMTEIVDGPKGIDAMRTISPWFFADGKGGGDPKIPSGEAPLMLDWIVARIYGRPLIKYTESLTLGRCFSEIDAGRAVVLRTILTPEGHIVAMVGYTMDDIPENSDPARVQPNYTGVIVRDSWGNFNTGYADQNGNNVELSLLTFINHVRIPGQPQKAGHVIVQEAL
jgi:hypothetical protein